MSDQIRELTADIVASYLRNNPLDPEDIPVLIDTVYRSLSILALPVAIEPLPRSPVISVKRSITTDYIICLDCGYKAKVLRRHLMSVHQLTPDQYRARWRLTSDYPIIAPGYSELRSSMARESGLGLHGRHRRAISDQEDGQ